MTEYIAFDETELSQGIKELIARERSEERRATVERIRARVVDGFAVVEDYDAVIRILDEEAQR